MTAREYFNKVSASLPIPAKPTGNIWLNVSVIDDVIDWMNKENTALMMAGERLQWAQIVDLSGRLLGYYISTSVVESDGPIAVPMWK